MILAVSSMPLRRLLAAKDPMASNTAIGHRHQGELEPPLTDEATRHAGPGPDHHQPEHDPNGDRRQMRVADRGEAIKLALSLAHPGDIVLACGKGHEQSMCFGEIEYPWDDREALRAALRGSPLKTLPTAQQC